MTESQKNHEQIDTGEASEAYLNTMYGKLQSRMESNQALMALGPDRTARMADALAVHFMNEGTQR